MDLFQFQGFLLLVRLASLAVNWRRFLNVIFMKKALLACSLIVSSCFFTYAQLSNSDGSLKVNFGKVCTTTGGKTICTDPSTGQFQIVTGNGRGITGNVNTGQFGGSGTIGGVRFNANGTVGGSGSSLANNPNYSGLLGFLALAQTIASRLVPFLIGLALLAFFWYLITFIWKGASNPDEQKKGKAGMLYSILAIFVMVSIWGIIAFAGNILGIGQGGDMHGFTPPGQKATQPK